jgi:hypothetical protein
MFIHLKIVVYKVKLNMHMSKNVHMVQIIDHMFRNN